MQTTFLFTILFYVLSAGGYISYLIVQRKQLHRMASYILLIGFLMHCAWLTLAYSAAGHMPVGNLSETLSFCAWAVAAVFLIFQYKYNIKILGAYAAPMLALLMLAAFILPPKTVADPKLLQKLWLSIHITTIFLGDAAMALACGAGILYLVQERAIKSKKPGYFFKRLPSLELLDNGGYACIVTGFTLLTIGLITGLISAKLYWGRFWSWDVKEVWSALAWIFYAVLLHERLTVGWRGRRSALMAIIGFGVLIFTFLGVNLLLKGHHSQFTL
ncbi:MAG: c-type cytochrome biogenesis protein CcsB [Desulfobacteraceae bacterium]|nr:c-type cytochrome biogenesis protein CcsB [Desulfobacteraceae bacterium]